MKKVFIAIVAIVAMTLVGGTLFWYFVIYQKPPSNPSGTTNPTPAVGFGNLKPYASLCAKFRKTEAKISCEKAAEIALEHSPGKIQKISIGPVRTSIPSESGSPERRSVDMWLIDIALTIPYFDDKFNKQINVLQIGIRIDEHNLIYQKPIE